MRKLLEPKPLPAPAYRFAKPRAVPPCETQWSPTLWGGAKQNGRDFKTSKGKIYPPGADIKRYPEAGFGANRRRGKPPPYI
jgi:hypothetical protein